jgi:hypothetical protein
MSHEFGRTMTAGVVGFGMGAAAMFGVEQGAFNIDGLIPRPHISLGQAQPPSAEASVDQGSYTTVETFDVTCTETIGLGVNVTAHEHQTFGSGNVNKRIFGEVELCGSNDKLESAAFVQHSKATGQVQSVSAIFPGVSTHFARVNHDSVANCAGVRVKDTEKQAQTKIDDWNKAKNDGKKPGCDRIFHMSGIVVSDSATAAGDIAWSAAQLDMELDAKPPQAMLDLAAAKIKQDELNTLRGLYPGAPVTLFDPSKPLTPLERLKTDVEAVRSDFAIYSDDHFERDKSGNLVLALKQPGGASARVTFSSQNPRQVSEAEVAQYNTMLDQVLNPSLPAAA